MRKETKYTLPLGTVRYRVDVMDVALLEKLAKEDGWQDGESYFDYLDPIDNAAVLSRTFSTKSAAVAYALKNAERDVFRAPTIDELELIEEVITGTRFREWRCTNEWLIDDNELVDKAAA